MPEIELKPCPFCGGKARLFYGNTGYYTVQCTVCGAGTISILGIKDTIDAWNRRAPNDQKGT